MSIQDDIDALGALIASVGTDEQWRAWVRVLLDRTGAAAHPGPAPGRACGPLDPGWSAWQGHPAARHAWRIVVHYRTGGRQAWPCGGEATARREYGHLAAECGRGRYPDVASIELQRQPIDMWTTVERWTPRKKGQSDG